MSYVRTSAAVLSGVLATCMAVGAQAQTARSGGAASAQLQQQMQQLASERTSLQAENERMKKELDDLRKERDQLKRAQQGIGLKEKSSEAALARSSAQKATAEQELAQSKSRMQELVAKFRETLQVTRETETENATMRQSLATRDRELKVCVDRNAALSKLNDAALGRVNRQGIWSRVARAEPFTQIKRVQYENQLDDFRARAQEQRVPAPSALPALGPPRQPVAQAALEALPPAPAPVPAVPTGVTAAPGGSTTAPAPTDHP